MDFGAFAFTPEGVATVTAGFVIAGAVVGIFANVMASILRGINF